MKTNIELKQMLSYYIKGITDLSGHAEDATLSGVIAIEGGYTVFDIENWLRGLPSCLDVVYYDEDCKGMVEGWLQLDGSLLVNNNLESERLADAYFKVLASFLAH